MALHELTACLYYKLALDRGLRGCDPEGELDMHIVDADAMYTCSESAAEMDEALCHALR